MENFEKDIDIKLRTALRNIATKADRADVKMVVTVVNEIIAYVCELEMQVNQLSADLVNKDMVLKMQQRLYCQHIDDLRLFLRLYREKRNVKCLETAEASVHHANLLMRYNYKLLRPVIDVFPVQINDVINN
jgi:hypothetical protein